jgi:hypothetical protein
MAMKTSAIGMPASSGGPREKRDWGQHLILRKKIHRHMFDFKKKNHRTQLNKVINVQIRYV